MVDAFQLGFNTSDVSLSQLVCGFKSCKSLACVHIASVTAAMIAKSLNSSALTDEELVYMLEVATEDNISSLSEDDRSHVEPLLMQIAEKLTARIENETSSLRKVLSMLSAIKKPT